VDELRRNHGLLTVREKEQSPSQSLGGEKKFRRKKKGPLKEAIGSQIPGALSLAQSWSSKSIEPDKAEIRNKVEGGGHVGKSGKMR